MKNNLIDDLLTLSNIKISMSRDQFRSWRNDELTLTEIKLINKADKEIGKLNKIAYNTLLVAVAGTISAFKIYENTLTVTCMNPMSGIDSLGTTFLGIFQGLGRWVCLIMAFIELIKAVMKGNSNTSEIFAIILKYVLVYASMFLVPYFFDIVSGAF